MKVSRGLSAIATVVSLGLLPQVAPIGFSTPAAYATTPAAGSCSDSSGELICNVDSETLSFSQTSTKNSLTSIKNQNTGNVGILASASVGDSVRYENVFTGDDGTIVDALVQVTSVPTGASDVDQDDAGSFGPNPISMFPGTGSLTVSVNFVDDSDNAVKMQNLQVVVKDLDEDSRVEFAEFTGLTSYTLDTNTDLDVSTPSSGIRRFTGTTNLGSTSQVGWVVVNFPTVSTIGLTGGHSSGSGGGIGFSFQGGTVLSSPATPVSVAAATYTVSFDLDGGSGTTPTSVSGAGELIFPAASGQSKNGVSISGWTARSGGSGTRVALGGTHTPISDTTFYAEYDGASVGSPSATSGTVGEAFSSTLSTSGFSSDDLTFAVASGTLPAGLSLNSSTAVISGTPTAAGSETVTVTATHSAGGSATSSNLTLTMAKGAQSITWSPSTALTLADSGLTLAATLTVGDGSLGYTVVNAGTTGCSVSGSILSFDSLGSGANGCEVRPTASGTTNYNAKNDASTVTFDVSRGTFAITAPSSKVGTSSSAFTNVCVSSCDITGFAPDDVVRVVVSKSDGSSLSGEVKLTSATGLTQSLDGYQSNALATGLSELAFTGTQAQVNAALETLQYKSPSGGGDETLGISASLNGAAYFSGTGHYYEVISGANKTHAQAITAAASRTFNGLNGYLATILTEEENRFIDGKISDRSVWIGGKYNGTEWEWITGPVSDQISFWSGTNPGSAISGVYAEWEPGQPDGSDVCLSTNYDGGDKDDLGNWDDLTCTASKKWVVEYGGNGGTVLKQASTTFDVGAPTAPLQVSGVSVSAGNAQLTVSWSAPGTGGSAITDYVIEQSTDGGTTWTTLSDGTSTSTTYTVTGLTNGSSYSFRVSAKNAIGTGTASLSASGTPVVPAATSTSRNNDDDEPVVTSVVTPNVTRPTVRLPFPTPTPSRPTILSAPVRTSTSVSTPVDRLVSRIGGVPAPVTTSTNGDDELSVSTSSLKLSLKMSQQSSVSETSDANAELTIKPGAKAAVTATGLLPNTTLQVWLPNVSERELGRLSVNAAGEIQGELGLSSSFGEDPLPVGRQTLQMTGYDVEGNQTVVEMPVNIAQGPPTPEPNRQEGALPELGTGQSLATSAGVPTPTTVTVLDEQNEVSVTGDGWGINLNIPAVSGTVEDENGQPVIRLVQSSVASMSGSGMQPGTIASVWFFSEPTLMGTVAVAEDGSFTLDVMVDAQFIPAGNHTVQVQGVGTDGYIKSVNMGVLVEEPAAQTTAPSAMVMFWWALAAAVVIALFVVIPVSRRRRQA